MTTAELNPIKSAIEETKKMYESLSYKDKDEYVKGMIDGLKFSLALITKDEWTPEKIQAIAKIMEYTAPEAPCIISSASEHEPDDEKATEEIWLTLDEAEQAAARANEINATEDEARTIIYNMFDAKVKKEIKQHELP